MKDPVRDLPRVINTAMIIVVIGFSLMAVALYAVIPIQSMRETSTPIVVRIPIRLNPLIRPDIRHRISEVLYSEPLDEASIR